MTADQKHSVATNITSLLFAAAGRSRNTDSAAFAIATELEELVESSMNGAEIARLRDLMARFYYHCNDIGVKC